MKYQRSFLFYESKKENARKLYFGPHLGLFGPNLGYNFFPNILCKIKEN